MSNNTKNNKTENSNKATAKDRALSVIGTIACIILIPIIIVNVILIAMSFIGEKTDMPSVGNYFPLMVKSGSMSGEIEVGDLIFVKTIDDASTLKVGDVITFWDNEPGGTLVTHRITAVTTDEDGKLAYTTKGDANIVEDEKAVSPDKIVGLYNSRIAHLGDVALFMQTLPGMLICVGGPLLLMIIYDVFRRRREKKIEGDEKDKLLAELEELKSKQAQADKSDESSD